MAHQNPMTIAANRAFVDRVEAMTVQNRLREAILVGLGREERGEDKPEGKMNPTEEHHFALLEGKPAPEARLIAYKGFQQRFKAEEEGAVIFALGDCQLGYPGTRELARLLTPPVRPPLLSSHLVYLDISDNGATELGTHFDALRDICYQLVKCTGLKFLSLHNTALLDRGSAMVARLLRHSNSLRVLDISRCNIGDKGANALYSAFCSADEYDSDALEGSEGDDKAVPPVTEAIESTSAPAVTATNTANTTEVITVEAPITGTPTPDNLGFNFHTNRPGSAGASVRPKSALRSKVAAAAAKNPLTAANTATTVTTTTTTTGASTTLPTIESANTSLEWLDVSNNNLGGFGLDPLPGAKLVRALMEHPNLQYLDLSRNRFTRSIVTSLIVGLEVNKSLTHLILDSNNIDAVPATAMAEAIHKHPRMQHVSLRFNSVRSDGAAAFAHIFEVRPNHTLRYLDLRDNYIGPVGTRAMLGAVGITVPPETLGLAEPTYDAAGKEDYHIAADRVLEVGDTPAGSGVILVGSGAKALLTLRRQARQAAAPSTPTSEHTTTVTADGVIMQPVKLPADADGDAGRGGVTESKSEMWDTRIIRMDAPVITAVLNATAY